MAAASANAARAIDLNRELDDPKGHAMICSFALAGGGAQLPLAMQGDICEAARLHEIVKFGWVCGPANPILKRSKSQEKNTASRNTFTADSGTPCASNIPAAP
jgi:hypothetical protein